MNALSTPLHWTDMLLRLALTVVAGVLIGYNLSEHGKAAGMRTTLLVCLAACVAMLQVNFLLPTAGRSPNSFVMNDLMRLPLGILTGVGFIGAGAILRRENMVVGVTTAATLWLVTVIGLCLGGGQLVLGAVTTLLGLIALWGLKAIEDRLPQERFARISIEVAASGPGEAEIRGGLRPGGLLPIGGIQLTADGVTKQRRLAFQVREVRKFTDASIRQVVNGLAAQPGIVRIEWRG